MGWYNGGYSFRHGWQILRRRTESDTDPNSLSDRNGDSYGYRDCTSDTYCYTHTDSYRDCNNNAYCYTHTDSEFHTQVDSHAKSSTHARTAPVEGV